MFVYTSNVLLLHRFRNIVDGCVSGISQKGYLRLSYKIDPATCRKINVCRTAFCRAYQIGESYLESLCKDIKRDRFNCNAENFTDRTNVVGNRDGDADDALANQAEQLAFAFGIDLSVEQLAAMKLPNIIKAIFAYGWLNYYFSLVVDNEPNTNNEVHIEYCTLSDVYKEYLYDLQGNMDPNDIIISVERLARIWRECFP